MELRSPADFDAFDWAFLAAALALAGIHLYLGLSAPSVPGERATQFVVIGLVLLVVPLVYLTPFWRPPVYLLAAGVVLSLGVLWVLGGTEYVRFGALSGVAGTGFVALALYLFVRAEARAANT